MPKVSVIVPIYNTEQYLHQCVDSILAQTYKDFEVLLIDDGSTDNSGAICDEYANKDARIKVFHNNNMGSAAARQFGFERAQGKYIAAVDSDDWVDKEYVANMVTLIKNDKADLVMCAYWINEDNYMSNKPTDCSARIWQNDMLYGNCHAGLWNKLLKKELLLSNDMLVPKCNYYEDMVVTLSYLHLCAHVVYDSQATYHYRQNPTSLTNDQDFSKRIRMYEECMMNLAAVSEKYNYLADDKLTNALYSRVNGVKERLLTYRKPYKIIRPYLIKYFPHSTSIIPITDSHTWVMKKLLQGHVIPYLIINIYNWTKRHIKKLRSRI